MATIIHTDFGDTTVHHEGGMAVFGYVATIMETSQQDPEITTDELGSDTPQEIAKVTGAVAVTQAIET